MSNWTGTCVRIRNEVEFKIYSKNIIGSYKRWLVVSFSSGFSPCLMWKKIVIVAGLELCRIRILSAGNSHFSRYYFSGQYRRRTVRAFPRKSIRRYWKIYPKPYLDYLFGPNIVFFVHITLYSRMKMKFVFDTNPIKLLASAETNWVIKHSVL